MRANEERFLHLQFYIRNRSVDNWCGNLKISKAGKIFCLANGMLFRIHKLELWLTTLECVFLPLWAWFLQLLQWNWQRMMSLIRFWWKPVIITASFLLFINEYSKTFTGDLLSCLTRIPILPREVRRSMQYLLQTCMSVMSWKLKYNQHCSWTVNLQMLPLPKINLTSNSSLPWAVIHLLGTNSYQVSKALPDTLQ